MLIYRNINVPLEPFRSSNLSVIESMCHRVSRRYRSSDKDDCAESSVYPFSVPIDGAAMRSARGRRR